MPRATVEVILFEKIAATGLASRFDRMFLSYEIGHLKPSPDAFLHAIRCLGVAAPNVLFIDDSATNVTAAAALGIQARLARNALEARSVLADYGIVL
jgi:FMN phosphatase YigB (HAD superfamily)